MEFEHIPVLLQRVLEEMPLRENAVIVDGTLGLGGYSEAFLKCRASWRVVGIDRDAGAREIAGARLKPYGERFKILPGDFRNMKHICLAAGVSSADCVVLDLGVSNMQLVDGARGFSFRENGPLDMRMDRQAAGPTAADLVNKLSREALTDIFRKYGEERFAWRIAGEIVAVREKTPFETTAQLVEVLRKAMPAPAMRKMSGHPARRVFQALRIAVNDELGALEQGLREAFELLSEDGRLLVVTYHSLEDRIVKHQMRAWCSEGLGLMEPRRGIVPDDAEIEDNPKSRSARLRGFHKKFLPTLKEGTMGPWHRC